MYTNTQNILCKRIEAVKYLPKFWFQCSLRFDRVFADRRSDIHSQTQIHNFLCVDLVSLCHLRNSYCQSHQHLSVTDIHRRTNKRTNERWLLWWWCFRFAFPPNIAIILPPLPSLLNNFMEISFFHYHNHPPRLATRTLPIIRRPPFSYTAEFGSHFFHPNSPRLELESGSKQVPPPPFCSHSTPAVGCGRAPSKISHFLPPRGERTLSRCSPQNVVIREKNIHQSELTRCFIWLSCMSGINLKKKSSVQKL